MEYFVSVGNEKRGPYSIEELKARGITAETLVMAVGTDQWIPAWQVSELRQILYGGKDGNTAGGSDGNTAGGVDYEEVEGKPIDDNNFQQGRPVTPTPPPAPKKRSGGCLKTFLILIVALLAIAGIAVVTCPDENAHKAALTEVVSATVSDELNGTDSTFDGDDIVDKMFRQMSDSWTEKIIATAVDNLIHVDNHVLFSTGKVRFDGKVHTVSVGVFGHVFTVDKEDLKAATESYYTKAEKTTKEDLQKKASKMIKENVIDPAAKAAKEMVGDAIDDLLDDLSGALNDDDSISLQHQ